MADEALAKSAWRESLLCVRDAGICPTEVGKARTNFRARPAG